MSLEQAFWYTISTIIFPGFNNGADIQRSNHQITKEREPIYVHKFLNNPGFHLFSLSWLLQHLPTLCVRMAIHFNKIPFDVLTFVFVFCAISKHCLPASTMRCMMLVKPSYIILWIASLRSNVTFWELTRWQTNDFRALQQLEGLHIWGHIFTKLRHHGSCITLLWISVVPGTWPMHAAPHTDLPRKHPLFHLGNIYRKALKILPLIHSVQHFWKHFRRIPSNCGLCFSQLQDLWTSTRL